jgi:hypothetical protein
VSTLSDRLVDIFEKIIETYDSRPPERRSRLVHHRSFQRETFLEWDETQPLVTRDDLDELHDFGLIDLDFTGSGDYAVRPTQEGRQAFRTVQRERLRAETSQPVDLSWATVRPILHAVVDAWTDEGASSAGFVKIEAIARRVKREPDDLELIRAIEVLATNDWLRAEYDEESDDLSAQPTMRGVMATRGWPGGDGEVAAERFLSTLEELAAHADDTETRGWAARARDTLMEVGTKTLAEVVSKSVGTAM